MKNETANKPPRILIVDDDPIICAFLGEMLEEMDAQVSYAHTGEAALKLALEIRPDVILLDINLPDTTGIEVCLRFRALPELVRTPVIFCSALSEIENEAEAIKAGAVGFVPKPPHRALVTANVQNALRMRHMDEEIERLVDYREKLTHMIVHDINNLLMVNVSSADLLMQHPELPPTLMRLAETIYNSGSDIRVMTASLLDVAKLESQTLPLKLEPINLAEIIQQRAQLVNHQIKMRELQFALDERQRPVVAHADSYLLVRVIDNLLFNAIKFCPVGGEIRATVQREDSLALVSLANDGPPIPVEFHDKIFAPFAQIEGHQKKSSRGVGLGLALCRMATLAMNGQIGVESPLSDEKGGVRFNLRLPAASS